MKKNIIYMLFLISVSCLGQTGNVGINISAPERTLDVNGDVRVTQYSDKTSDSTFDQLVTANSTGNVDFVRKQSLVQNDDNQVEVGRVIYNATTSTEQSDKWAKCGIFKISVGNGYRWAFIDPTQSYTINFGREKRGNGTYSYQDLAAFDPNTSITNFSGDAIIEGNRNVINVIENNSGDLYRLTFTVNKNTATTNTYVAVCERFYNID